MNEQITTEIYDDADIEVPEQDFEAEEIETESAKRAERGSEYLARFTEYAERLADDSRRLKAKYEEYKPSIRDGFVPATIRSDALSLSARMQIKSFELADEILRAISEKPDVLTVSAGEVFASSGQIEAHMKEGTLYVRTPLPVRSYALSFAGASIMMISELKGVLEAVDMHAMTQRSRYLFAFEFVHPKSGKWARDHDNYYIKPVIDTICMHMGKSDDPAEMALALATVFSDTEMPHMRITVTPLPQEKSITELAKETVREADKQSV